MKKNNIDLFSKIKDKNFNDSLSELLTIHQNDDDIIYELIFLPLIKMNYLNYLYELIIDKCQFNKMIEFIQKLTINNNKFPLIFMTHLEYVIIRIPNELTKINYCISLISYLKYLIIKDKSDLCKSFIINTTFNIYKNINYKYSNIFNCLFNNPNLSFEIKYKLYEELINSIGKEVVKDSSINIKNIELFYFINFYKNKVLNNIPLIIPNGNNNNNNNNEEEINNYYYQRIMLEYFQIGYLYEFIYKLSLKYKSKTALKTFKNYLDSFINIHPYLAKKYKYNYSNETFQIIKDYIFLNAKNEYFSHIEGEMNEQLLFEFILNNEKLSNFNLINPKESLFLGKILLSGKYDYSDYIINNWNTIFPHSLYKEKKFNKAKPEIDGDNTDSEVESEDENEEEEEEEELLISLDNFIKSLLSLDYSNKSKNRINCDKLFTFLESKMHIIIKYYSYSIIPNYYDIHKYLMRANQPPSYYRFCINYILTKNIIINYKNINNPIRGKHNLFTKSFKPEMNIFIKNIINNLVYNWNEEFNFTEFLNEIKQRVCIYCLLLINIHDSIENRLKDVDNFFNNFLYILDPNTEAYLSPYKEVLIYYCNKLKIKPYNTTSIYKRDKINNNNNNNKESIIEQKNSYWLNLYKIMILIYIRKKYITKFNPELLWEGLNNYYDIKGIFNLLLNYSKNENNTFDMLFEKELIPRFCIFTNKGVYFNVLNKIKDFGFIKLLVDKRNELEIKDNCDLFIEVLERLLTNKNVFKYLWELFDDNYKKNLIKKNIKKYIEAYFYYTFKRFHFFQNKMIEGLKLVFSDNELKELKLINPLKEEFPINFNYDEIKFLN